MPHLLLINPSNRYKGLGNLRATAWPPLNLPYLAALTPAHYRIEVIDENIEPFAFKRADIVGITAFTASVTRAYRIAQMYHSRGITTVMGGIHVSMMPEEALSHCHAVVIGEAESVWSKVLADFEAGNLKRRYYGSWTALDRLPMPRRDILKNDYYKWGSIQTSRGCPMDCAFCSVTAFNGSRFRRRPLEAVIDELEHIPQKRVLIADDNVIGYSQTDRDWAKAFFSKILERKIQKTFMAQTSLHFAEDRELIRVAAKAGVKIVFIGIESVNPDSLKSYRKRFNLMRLRQDQYHMLISRIRNAGIAVLGAFVIGSDDDDIATFHATLEFITSSHIDILQITKPTPLPGTPLWSKLAKEGRIIDLNFPKAWEEYRLTKMVYRPLGMSIDEVYQGFTYIRKQYYGFWNTVKRTLRTLGATKSVETTALAYAINASYRKAFITSRHYKMYDGALLTKKFLPARPNALSVHR
jgi:radical SAM superfamily enzyme YgiQ (UPF0313 family)